MTHNGMCPFPYGLRATGETIELCVAETIVVHSCEVTKMIHNGKWPFLYCLRATGAGKSIETLCGRKP